MTQEILPPGLHPSGEQLPVDVNAPTGPTTLDTFAGPVRVEWDRSSPLTPLGQFVYFIEFLKVSGRLDAVIGDCPLTYTSPNAPEVRDVIGTWILSILAGHKRYAHVTTLRCDDVLPELMGLSKIVSEDSLRHALEAIPEAAGLQWEQAHMDRCTLPLLSENYIIDIDPTVKPLYGHQEGAVIGYNPKKPGRPSHVHHTYMLAGLRLVLGVETAPGNQHTGSHSVVGLWKLIDDIPRDCWPTLLRGDSSIASEGVMRESEGRGINYLFKLRLTKNVKTLIERTFMKGGWSDAGQGWQGKTETLRLVGWSRHRRVTCSGVGSKRARPRTCVKNPINCDWGLPRARMTRRSTNMPYSSLRSMQKCLPSPSYTAIGLIVRSTSHGDSQESVIGCFNSYHSLSPRVSKNLIANLKRRARELFQEQRAFQCSQ